MRSWRDKLDILRDLDNGAHLKFPDVYGNYYLSTRIEKRVPAGWMGSGYNNPTPARCVNEAFKDLTSARPLLLVGGDKKRWTGRDWADADAS